MPKLTIGRGIPEAGLTVDEFLMSFLELEILEALESEDWETLSLRLQEKVRRQGIDILL